MHAYYNDEQRSKWERYYAANPLAAPWDTHAASSQLHRYLCYCPFNTSDTSFVGKAEVTSSVIQVKAPYETSSAMTVETERTGVPASSLAHVGIDHTYQYSAEFRAVDYQNCSDLGLSDESAAPERKADGALEMHVCELCAHLKPHKLCREGLASVKEDVDRASVDGGLRYDHGIWALELCCGTGASLAFMHRLGFSVVGVELVAAACKVAAARLAAVVGSAVAVQSVNVVADMLRLYEEGTAAEPPRSDIGVETGPGPMFPSVTDIDESTAASAQATQMMPSTAAFVAQGDLFTATWPHGFFDFAYDCQGLHAMPPTLRPAYVAMLHDAVRRGGLVLLLVGRAEDDDHLQHQPKGANGAMGNGGQLRGAAGAAATGPGLAMAAAGAEGALLGGTGTNIEGGRELNTGAEAGGDDGGQRAASHDGVIDGAGAANGGSKPSSNPNPRGPSLMTQSELEELFGGKDKWEWCWCKPTRLDVTPMYSRLPRPPPAWCLMVRRL